MAVGTTPGPPGPAGRPPGGSAEERVADAAAVAGIRRVHVVAWRDLDDPGAGGSEIHVTAVAGVWARAGIEVLVRTAAVPGLPARTRRQGYDVVRRGGPWSVFGRAPLAEALRGRRRDALVEVWHGVNFLAPWWTRGPRVAIAHHVHAEQFEMVLPPVAARVARVLERRVYPRVYRSTPLVTLSRSGRDDLAGLGYRPDLVTVATPGVGPHFRPGGERSATPLVLAVGRLMPQKRFDVLVDVLVELRGRHPRLRATIVGEGPERAALEGRISHAGAGDWLTLRGRVSDEELVDLYRTAWVVAGPSMVEGWGMTLTEAGACGTPAVATRISGHLDAVVDGETGFLAAGTPELLARLDEVISDPGLRERLGSAAREHAARFTWGAAAETIFEVLAADARRRRRR